MLYVLASSNEPLKFPQNANQVRHPSVGATTMVESDKIVGCYSGQWKDLETCGEGCRDFLEPKKKERS